MSDFGAIDKYYYKSLTLTVFLRQLGHSSPMTNSVPKFCLQSVTKSMFNHKNTVWNFLNIEFEI